ncbi:MAG TPA: hypothetical protein VI306_20040 [Pyrinomonadaceae bacterium]
MRLFKFLSLAAILIVMAVPSAFADVPKAELDAWFPAQVAGFRRIQAPAADASLNPAIASIAQSATAQYEAGGNRLLVEVIKFHQDTEAYSWLSVVASDYRQDGSTVDLKNDYGTASITLSRGIWFFKGTEFVGITTLLKAPTPVPDAFARGFADTIDAGEADIPALVKHLPNANESQKKATFLTRFDNLNSLLPGQAILDAIQTDKNADAAFVSTEGGKVLLVEYNTPQLAKENDDRIVAKIQELWKLGQPAPTAYKRVGNYSVLVFDAADNESAKKLIDQVKYEQVVQWLGDNPNIYKEAQKRYVETTLGVFIAVIKASGFALVGCLGLGGLIGALLFTRRRAQQKTQEVFSDAGGMLRLNIDELTPQTDPARLLGPGR